MLSILVAGSLSALIQAGYEPACLEALRRFETPPRGAACLSLEWNEEEGWLPTGAPALTPEGFADPSRAWIGIVDEGCCPSRRRLGR